MRTRRFWTLLTLAAATLGTAPAFAQDRMKLAVGQRGYWDSAPPYMGERAGIFRKHGIELDILYTQGGGETLQAAISASVDAGIAAGTLGVFGAYSKGAPIRIIGAEATGSADYWYVRTDSPIQSIKDLKPSNTLAYSTNGSSTNTIVRSFTKLYGLQSKLVATGGSQATYTQVMSGQVDVGWSSPPFGLDALAQGKIRIVGRGADAPGIKDQSIRVIVTHTGALESRRDVLKRFMKAYGETVDWMYASPEAIPAYAEFAGVTEEVARHVRDEFFPKALIAPYKFEGVEGMMEDAVTFKTIPAPLTRAQLDELVLVDAFKP